MSGKNSPPILISILYSLNGATISPFFRRGICFFSSWELNLFLLWPYPTPYYSQVLIGTIILELIFIRRVREKTAKKLQPKHSTKHHLLLAPATTLTASSASFAWSTDGHESWWRTTLRLPPRGDAKNPLVRWMWSINRRGRRPTALLFILPPLRRQKTTTTALFIIPPPLRRHQETIDRRHFTKTKISWLRSHR